MLIDIFENSPAKKGILGEPSIGKLRGNLDEIPGWLLSFTPTVKTHLAVALKSNQRRYIVVVQEVPGYLYTYGCTGRIGLGQDCRKNKLSIFINKEEAITYAVKLLNNKIAHYDIVAEWFISLEHQKIYDAARQLDPSQVGE